MLFLILVSLLKEKLKYIAIITGILFYTFTTSQTTFLFPIDTVDITGNFGEIRNQHFHQGIDFSTRGNENYPVKSIDEGYVYRIKISSVGYGKALYIHHPSGILSVYAHLNAFSNKIQSPLNSYLLKNNINEIDIILKKDSIKVSKNEVIGYSGNTGTSTGPHLHFEIRDELTEIPINPFFYFQIKDKTKPVVEKIIFYNLSDTLHPIPYIPKVKKDTIIIPSIFGIAFSGYDKVYPRGNPNNIYQVQIFLDNKKIYQHRLHYITFDNTIYVEYYADKINKQIFQKCFAPHLYPPNFYDTLINKGRIILSDTNAHSIKLIFCDENNNCTDTSFYIKTKKIISYKNIPLNKVLKCTEPIHIKNQYFELLIPEKSLFNDLFAKISYNTQRKRIEFSHTPLPLRYAATLKIFHQLTIRDLKKTLLVAHNRYYLPDTFNTTQIIFTPKELSNFYLYTDHQAPTITPLHFNKKNQSIILSNNQKKVYFKIDDNTKVKKITAYFNNQFCLSYYYSSKKLLEVALPEEYIATDEYFIKIIATDMVDNQREKSYRILFK